MEETAGNTALWVLFRANETSGVVRNAYLYIHRWRRRRGPLAGVIPKPVGNGWGRGNHSLAGPPHSLPLKPPMQRRASVVVLSVDISSMGQKNSRNITGRPGRITQTM